MSGRPKRGPGRPRLVDTGMSPTRCIPPASPLTPDSEEGFIVNEAKSSRSRGRPKGPIKKTRVNAQSKLKSPIRAAHSGSSTERIDGELDIKKEAAYANAVDAMGQPLVQDPNIPTSEEYVPSDKVCAFCCCGPERRMYQGKLHLCAPTPGFNPFKKSSQTRRQNSTPEQLSAEPADTGKEAIDDVPQPQPMVHRRGPGRPPGRGRKKGAVVIGFSLRNNGQSLSPDKCMFGSVREKDASELFESDGSVYAHHCCASWSEGVCQTDSYDLVNVDKAVFAAMSERCAHCNRYGASVVCQVPRCGKTYHYPCAASAGAFQEIQSMTMLCPDHLEDAGRLGGTEAQCYLCGEAKDFSEMLFCTSCGRHYHGRCLDPAVDITSLVRMSWQCPDCKVCQGCRQPGDDTKMLVCDLCDKGFHTYCLDPPMTTIPKTGWKCVGCRRCEDCGSNTPGGGPTSRWHRHYTVCDSCYQQRNKGLFCQICGRAYRQLSDVAMVQCESCEKWLHAECDNVSEEVYNKINSKKLSYFCPQCKGNGENHAQSNHRDNLSFEDQSMNDDPVMTSGEEDKRTLTSAAIGRITPSPMDEDLNLIGLDSNLDELSSLRPFGDSLMDPESLPLGTDTKLPLDEEMESVMKPDLDMFESSSGLPDSPPPSDHANEVKPPPPQSFRSFAITPPKTGGKRKLGPKLKAKTNSTPAKKKAKHGRPGRPPTKLKKQASVQSSPGKENVSGAANAAENTAKEEETEGLHTTLVLFSAEDKFTTEQDMCLCCGSFGKGREGQLIACSQCGQSYHPYCVGVKVNKIILNNGWRCLDCTLCEGCGKGSDEARLLLCDSCDISYHTYCLDPPLEKVPQGGWKCKWCVTCYDCGTLSPGKECEWQSNYTQCGPCASKITCPVCNIKYNENDLMIQCLNCDRWLHGSCDKLLTEDEVDKAAEYGYHCLFCRPKTKRALVCLSGPPSPRATALHHYRPQFSLENHPPQPQAKPIHPCQRLTNNGIVEMKLSNHFGRASLAVGNQSIAENENFLLTDSGLKQMNRLKITAYGRRKVKSKAKMKSKKLGNASDAVSKMEVMSPEHGSEASRSSDFEESVMDQKDDDVDYKPGRTKTTGRGVGGFLVKGRGAGARKFAGRGSKLAGRRKDRQPLGMGRGQANRQQSSFGGSINANFFAQQQSSLEAIMDSSSNEAWPEASDRMPLQEAYPEWMQEAFFGKSLLHPSRKKKPKQEPEMPTAPSEEEDRGLAEQSKNQGNIHRLGYHGSASQGFSFSEVHGDNQLHSQGGSHPNQQEVFNRPDQASTSHSVMGLEGGENWQGSNVEGLPADPLSLSEEFPNPDVLYRSLDMLTEDIPSSVTDSQTVSRGMEQDQPHLTDGSPQPNTNNNTSSVPSSQIQPSARGQQGELDLLSAAIDILPHVDGQEVEDIFADIELEMKSRDAVYSGIGGPAQSSMPSQVPRPNTEPRVPPPAYQAGHQDLQSFQQGPHPQPGMEPGLTHYPHFGQDRENFHGRPDIRNQHAIPGQYGYEGEHDFSKRSDLDLASDLPRDRRRPPSPRTDPMKQQQKWQEDERLGETATISPVLYANLEHTNLQKEYPDWPNRYRAIARLWRKLTVEQRDPYRLKARDNRVKLKDQGKRALLEQGKVKKEKPNPQETTQSPLKADTEKPQPTPPNPTQPQQGPETPPVQMEHQVVSSMNQDSNVTGQMQQIIPSQPNPPPYVSSTVAPMAPSQQLYQEMIASTQQSCVAPAAPLTMSNPMTPATPTSFTPTSPMTTFVQPNVDALPGGKGSRNMKGKKTKEDKEKEKEKRKQKLLIQQQQERQWKMLQQRRQLEQQRQQQQQQQETNLMRQEVKRTQQAKGLRALEDKKKKTPPKPPRKQSFSDSLSNVSSVSSEEPGSACDTPSQHSPAVSIHSDDSHSLTNVPPRDSSQLDSSLNTEAIRERRGSLPNLALSSHGLENMTPLSPLSNSNDGVVSRRPRSSSQQLPQGPWDEWHSEVPQQQDGKQSNPMWCDSTLNTLTQSQPVADPKPPNYSNPLVARQNSRPQSSDNNSYMPQHPAPEQHPQEGTRHEGLSFYVPQDQQRPPLTPGPGLPQASNEVLPMPQHDPIQVDIGEMQFHPQGVMNDQQARTMDSQQSLAHKQQDIPQWHPEMMQNHPQAGAQDQMGMTLGVPNQPNMMSQNQGQPKLQHPDLPRPHPYDFQQNWQHSSSGPNSMALQQPPQVQQASMQQQVSLQQLPLQPMTSMPNSSQNLPIPHQPLHHQSGMSQVPIQPAPPAPPPPPPLPQSQHSNLPIARQPPTDEQQQQQQLEMLQKQQREQLMRAQQQQYLQMQMQQQQHLMQQQPVALQPPFARPRLNPVVNTKDLPEIDSEEEHQERLRFLYRQRQLQKQQQMQLQAQQSLFQQPWQAPGLMPGLVPPDPSNPQAVSQMAPIRPQPPDIMQQQLMMEYQRRMQQRQELGQQSIQFDKVLQDLHQQQGTQQPVHQPPPPFLEVSHQRLAMRHPTPGGQPGMGPMVPGQVPGQFPVMGMDGQQLYRMQLQQQQILMQQQQQQQHQLSPRMIAQKQAPQTSSVVSKENVPEKEDKTAAPNQDTPPTESSGNQLGPAVSQGASQNSNKGEEKESEESRKVEQNQTTQPLPETREDETSTSVLPVVTTSENNQVSENLGKASEIEKQAENVSENDKQQVSESGENSQGNRTNIGEIAAAIDVSSCSLKDHLSEGKVDSSERKENDGEHVSKNGESTKPNEEQAQLVPEGENVEKSTEQFEEKSSTTEQPTSQDPGKLSESAENQNKPEAEGVPVTTSSEKQPAQSQPSFPIQSRAQDVTVAQQVQPVSQAPMPNQQQALHQQLMALQQRFFQMQQQRQIMMQQYQQLQQQLQQNQDPMVGGQLMALQQQGQFLQQNLLQVWQQIQMLQQQIQNSANLQQQPQLLPQPPMHGPSSGPLQGQQWPQGPMQDQQNMPQLGMMSPHPGMMNNPGVMQSPMPGQVSSSPSPKPEKPARKPRRSRAKSKDSHAPQPSVPDWMNPQPVPAKPVKGKGKKGKKQQEPLQDPEIQLQQQRLRQQILHQMEQRHRLIQQQQGSAGAALTHPDTPPTSQSADGPPGHPMGPTQHPFVPASSQSNVPNDFCGSPSMGIMTPEQINYSTSQLMNNPLNFQINPPQPNPQPITPAPQKPELRPAPVPCSPKPQPMPHTPGPPSEPSSPFLGGRRPDEPPNPHQVPQDESFNQRFPNPERFLQFTQQQVRHKQPVVQYVADANNPFSDDFQIQKNIKTEKAQPKKGGSKKKAVKEEPKTPAVSDVHATDLPIPEKLPDLNVPTTGSDVQKTQSTFEDSISAEIEKGPRSGAAPADSTITSCSDSKSERSENNEDPNTHEVVLSGKSNEVPSDDTVTEGKKGVSSQALQRLESMVADMASEDVCDDQVKGINTSELTYDLFNENADEEVANLCSVASMEANLEDRDPQGLTLCQSSSQANSVASLECHEEVPSFVSPTQDGEKADGRDRSQESSPIPQSLENNPTVFCAPSAEEDTKSALSADKDGNSEPQDAVQDGNSSHQEPVLLHSEVTSNSREATVLTETVTTTTNQTLASSEDLEQSLVSLPSVSESCTVSSLMTPVSDVPVSSVASGVLGGHLALPMESRPTEGDMAVFRQYNPNAADVTLAMNQPSQVMSTTQSTDHGAMLLSGRDPMLGGASPMLSSASSPSRPSPASKSITKGKPKAKRGKSDIKTQQMLKEEDLIKKSLQEARRQEYERKKREYEEQQRKKRELQKEMRQQKAKEKEERKRLRILSTSNKMKTKVNVVQKGKKNDVDSPAVTKESLPLCEPKLILTHALMHPYGTSPFNGQCSLKGALGRAHLDSNLDYYAKFPSPSLDLVLKVNNQKPLMNGDIDSKDFHKLREATDLPHKKPRYTEHKNEVVSGVVAPANGQLLADSSSVNSSSSSPETVQYVASSSPESDAINKPLTPTFTALNVANRNETESPTFCPVNAVQIKREQVGSSLLMTSSCCVSMQSSSSASSDLAKIKDDQTGIPRREGPSLGLDQDIDDFDSINVTLTLSPSSEMRVSETVASVAELIGCSPPRPSDIVIEPNWKSTGSITTTAPTSSSGIAYPQPRTAQDLSVLSPKEEDTIQKTPYPFTQFNLASKAALQQKPSDGPYCRHCDVLIIGIGVIRGPSDSSSEMTSVSATEVREVKVDKSSESGSDGSNYKIYSINVEASERRDCFCSEPCLKQYYSLLEAGRTRTKMETSESELNSCSCATTGSENATTDLRQDNRGSLVAEGLPVTSMVKLRRPSWKEERIDGENEIKRRREIKWRRWQAEDFKQKTKQDLTPEEISELLDKYEAVYKPKDLMDDTRKCILCSDTGDGDPEGPSRLLNLDVDVWVHLNCALWSLEVYETLNGALMNVMSAVQRGHDTECCMCYKTGATVVCNHMNAYNKVRCPKTYHFGCALKNGCMFFKDKTMLCQEHKPTTDTEHRLPSYAVFRKVFINRDEIQQIASMLRHNQENGGDKLQTLRIGSVVVKSLGQLLLHQLQTFHTRNAVYPVGFKTIRYYWSMTDVKKRCQYHCAVEDLDGKPSFTIRTKQGKCFRGISPKDAWNQILEPIQSLRRDCGLNLWPSYITGEDLFGLTEQYVLRIIESMPGVDYMQGYNMRYGPSPIMELPLAVNPTGSARSEPHVRSRFKTRTRSIRNTWSSTSSTSRAAAATSQPSSSSDDNNSPYMKHFVHSKASQYRKLKSEWKQNVYLGRSNIQGLGLFANKELEPNSMVIEYIGSIIRNEVANRKESIYESQNRGIYMFRIDSDSVIDATMAGAPARYINHSCMPNCVAEVVTFEKEQKIIIISNRKVERGEELTYDYKFDYEDDEHKISCLCGAPNCRKWMN